jgi:thiamine pyrophosphate-dependent acetolactate synthase large subunit-like protein
MRPALAIGVRFDDRVTSQVEAFAPHARIVHIDIDPVSIDKMVRADLAILSHCGPALETLNRLGAQAGPCPRRPPHPGGAGSASGRPSCPSPTAAAGRSNPSMWWRNSMS